MNDPARPTLFAMSFLRLCAKPLRLTGVVLMLLASAGVARAQDLPDMVERSIRMMQAGQWEDALRLHAQAIEQFGASGKDVYGPQFGAIYYRKGICELRLGRHDDAARSFEACYKEFPDNGRENGNPYEKTVLLPWAEAAMGMERWQQALDLFDKFLRERNQTRDPIPRDSFYLNMAICHYRLGHIPSGNENLEIAIKNKKPYGVPDAAILGAFKAMVSAAIAGADEQVILDFVGKNRGSIVMNPLDMYPYAPGLLSLAADAVKADMDRAAIVLYQMVPSTDAAIEEGRARIGALGMSPMMHVPSGTWVKAELEQQLELLEQAKRGGRSLETIKLGAMAFLHEKFGNVTGAYAAYKQLERYFPNADRREDHLFNLVRTAFMADAVADGLQEADQFLKDFPNSKRAAVVFRLSLSALFHAGDYPTCMERASKKLPTLKPGTPEHDLCLHVLGGSLFYTGQHEQAQPWLDQHAADYPNSPMAVAAAYFQAANHCRLRHYAQSAAMLDAFIAKSSATGDNAFLPYAMLDRAICDYWLGNYPEGLKRITTLIESHQGVGLLAQAWILRGNFHSALKQFPQAEKAFDDAYKAATKSGQGSIAAEALYHKVDQLVQDAQATNRKELLKKAALSADLFWKQGGESSPDAKMMAMIQMPAMEAAGRLNEALDRLRLTIASMAKDSTATELEGFVRTYTEAYLKQHTFEQLKDHYLGFPGIAVEDRAARALLRVEIIRVLQNALRTANAADRKHAAEAMLKEQFQQLKSDFELKDLNTAALIKLADFLRLKTATPREALPSYDEIIRRHENEFHFAALIGRADVYCPS